MSETLFVDSHLLPILLPFVVYIYIIYINQILLVGVPYNCTIFKLVSLRLNFFDFFGALGQSTLDEVKNFGCLIDL